MRAVTLLALLAALATLPPAAAKADGPDFTVTIADGGAPAYDGPFGWLHLVESVPGERYVWNVTLPLEYTVGEFRVRGLDVERPRQLVPTLVAPGSEYPLFEPYPDERVWEAEAAVRLFHAGGTGSDVILRLGIPRGNGTLTLQRDVTPPTYTLGPLENLTHRDFYQETRTGELALGDLQVREKGAQEWVQNPTTLYHFRQRFPVQGLDPATEYEARVVFTDWAGNVATTPTYGFRTREAPVVPRPVVTILEPAANATLPNGTVVIRARIEANESPIQGGDIRFFLDKREVRESLVFEDGVFSYAPPSPLAPGPHSVSIEATNAAGGTGVARWSFAVEDPDAATARTPAPGPLALLALAGMAALALRRR